MHIKNVDLLFKLHDGELQLTLKTHTILVSVNMDRDRQMQTEIQRKQSMPTNAHAHLLFGWQCCNYALGQSNGVC